MALLLIAILTTLSAVNCEHRKPFTAFHPAQRDYIENHKQESFVRSISPLIQAVDVGSRRSTIQNSQENTINGLVEANIKPTYRNGPREEFDKTQRQQLLIQQQYEFHPVQREQIQKQHHTGFDQTIHPVVQGLDVVSRLQKNQNTLQETVNGVVKANLRPARRIQEDFGLHQNPLSNFLQPSTFPFNSMTVVEQASSLVESVKTIFEALGNDSQANQNFDHDFETSDCLNNVQDAIELMEMSENLINEHGPEIMYLDAKVASLENEKNITTMILASAKMIKIFDDLLQNLSANSSNLCILSPEDLLKVFEKLAHVLVAIKNNKNIPTDDISRQVMETSSAIISKVGKFLNTFHILLSSKNVCESGKMKGDVVYAGIEEIMESLASLFNVLGFEEKSNGLKKQQNFVKKIVDSFSDIDELKASFKCMAIYGNLVLTLEHLAELVQSVGIEAMSKALGID